MAQAEALKEHSSFLNFVVRILDATFAILSGWLAYFFYYESWDLPPEYRAAVLLAALLTMLLFPLVADNYKSWRGRSWIEHLRVVIGSWAAVLMSLVVISALLKNTAVYSRFWFGLWAVLGVSILFIYKRILLLCLRQMRKNGWNRKSIVIYGAGDLGQMVTTRLKKAEWIGYDVIGYFDDNFAQYPPSLAGVPIYPGSEATEEFMKKNNVHELWLALPLRAEAKVNEILFNLRHSTVWIRFIPDIFSFRLLLNHSITEIAGIPALDLSSSPMSGVNRFMKAIEDRVLGFVIVLLISPLLVVIALAIKLTSKGPILFKQSRHGWDGRLINVYKFRTMVVHQEEAGRVTQATRRDPRITRVGAFLRRTSLDELPQFYNVLQGRMSIVGPRPHPVSLNEYYKDQVDYYFQRHKVKPGITGWAQVNGWRGETDTLEKMKKRIEFDLYYIQNWSIWFDLKIILLTVFKGFYSDNAY